LLCIAENNTSITVDKTADKTHLTVQVIDLIKAKKKWNALASGGGGQINIDSLMRT